MTTTKIQKNDFRKSPPMQLGLHRCVQQNL